MVKLDINESLITGTLFRFKGDKGETKVEKKSPVSGNE
jgi:hypothetical protein